MIAYGPNGPSDYNNTESWRIACDRCGTRAPWTDTDLWFVGESTECNVYCPRCTRRITRRLLRKGVGPIRYLKFARYARRSGDRDVWRAWGRYLFRRDPKG